MPLNDCCFEGKVSCFGVLRCIADATELKLWMILTTERKKLKIILTGCADVQMHPSSPVI